MKILAERFIETVIVRVCDVCEESVISDFGGGKVKECAELKAQWGYGSTEDGNTCHFDLCESCLYVALFALKDHRRSLVMFDEENNLPDDRFGLDSARNVIRG